MTEDLKVSFSTVLKELEELAETYDRQVGDGTGIEWTEYAHGIRSAAKYLEMRQGCLS